MSQLEETCRSCSSTWPFHDATPEKELMASLLK